MAASFTLGLLQLRANADGGDRLEDGVRAIREAAAQGAQICVLPELFRSPYFCQEMETKHFALAEPIPGPGTRRLGQVAAECGVVVVGSLFERAGVGVYFNTAVVLDADGTLLGKYRKLHIPQDPLYAEKFYFTPGDLPPQVFKTRFGKVGVLVCWDQWYPEVARLLALQGAEVIVYPTAIGSIDSEPAEEHARQLDAWQTVQRGHAIANGVFVAAVNRVGREGDIDFWGHSFAVGPLGEWLVDASQTHAELQIVHCDRDRQAEVRNIWPFFRDRRIDAYVGIDRRFAASNDDEPQG